MIDVSLPVGNKASWQAQVFVENKLAVGDSYQVQFVWKLPNYDFVRAFFQVTVDEIDHFEERYVVTLDALLGGRQEAADGSLRPEAEMTKPLWGQIVGFIGRKVRLPYESAEHQPLHLKYPTLTGEHNFFSRYEEAS